MTSISTRVRRGRISSMCTGFGYCRNLATDRPGAHAALPCRAPVYRLIAAAGAQLGYEPNI